MRAGTSVDEIVVAYPWRNSGRAGALGQGIADILDGVGGRRGRDQRAGARAAADALAAAPLGSAPELIKPTIPVVAVTGTNGKTTTSRMLGQIARLAGRSVGWSSTDGVYLNGELIEEGDYSGPSGAGRVLAQPGVEIAITETARGGILRRGVGTAWNDVSVVTNISADHLGLGGIDTLDQTRRGQGRDHQDQPSRRGWCVLNADDAWLIEHGGRRDAVGDLRIKVERAARQPLPGAGDSAGPHRRQSVLRAGVRPDHILFIVSGHASLLVEAAGGRIKFGTAEPGDYIGQTALTRERALSTAVAADLLTVLVVPLATLDTLVGSRPLLASEIGTSIELKRRTASEALATAGVARGLLTPY